ncbi:MAG: isoprenyl transferase [Planctomycetales bacterium]|nr:isoprenyl transferase [Planctomycetales bacterium]
MAESRAPAGAPGAAREALPSPHEALPPPREALPKSVAIIMDGNGRWAEARGLTRVQGHQAGVKTVREVSEECARLGIERLTLYAFSVENWKRPQAEVAFLMRLLSDFLVAERPTLVRNRVRLTSVGRIEGLPPEVQRDLRATEEGSRGHDGMVLCLALNYGGRAEIVDAARTLATEVRAGRLAPEEINEERMASALYAPGARDPDLLIRTGGEMRVSNFLLWQISYAELYVTAVLWPDFTRAHLAEAFQAYAGRERRYGGLPEVFPPLEVPPPPEVPPR